MSNDLWYKTAQVINSDSKYGAAIAIAKKPHDATMSKQRYNLEFQRKSMSEVIQPRIDFGTNPLSLIEPKHFYGTQNSKMQEMQRKETEKRLKHIKTFVDNMDDTIEDLNNPIFFHYKGSLFR